LGCSMLNYDVLSKKPLIFKSFTGLKVPELDAVYTKIQESYAAYEEKRLHREDRKRKIGAGHPFKLPLKIGSRCCSCTTGST